MKILFSLNLVNTQEIFLMLCNSNKDTAKTVLCLMKMFKTFVPTCAVAFSTKNGQNNTRKSDTQSSVPVASLYEVVGSPSSFIRSLIGITGKI